MISWLSSEVSGILGDLGRSRGSIGVVGLKKGGFWFFNGVEGCRA